MNKSIFIFLFVVIVLGVGVWFFKFRSVGATSDYTAVFLSNQQAYFGKVKNTWGSYLTLDDVYYLTVAQAKQGTTSAAPRLNQLGGEAHGPENSMRINRDQVLFMENLRADSPVVKGIEELKKQAAQK